MPKKVWVTDPNTGQGYSMNVEEADEAGLIRSSEERAEVKSRRRHLRVMDGQQPQMQGQAAAAPYQPPRQKAKMLKAGGVQCDFCDSVQLLDDDEKQRVAIHWMQANGIPVPAQLKVPEIHVRTGSQDREPAEAPPERVAEPDPVTARRAFEKRPERALEQEEADELDDEAKERAQEIRAEHEEAGVAGMSLNVEDNDFTADEKLNVLHLYRDGLKLKLSWQKLDRLCRDRGATREQVKRWDQQEKDGQLGTDEK